jgi:hypothetical protein
MTLREIRDQKIMYMWNVCPPYSTVVEHLTQNPEIKGSNHTGTSRDKTLEYYVSVELLSP